MHNEPLPKKSLGQHWLEDEASLWAMLDHAEVTADDTVLEIGPGLGPLTKLLVSEADSVVAVEFDEDLASGLAKRVPADNLKVVRSDILRFDLTSLAPDYKVVANIPYYLTSKLVRVLSESINPPLIATLLVQKEVAERLAAKPGQLSILGVTSQFYFDVSLGPVVKAELFTPPPKVDSQIVVLRRRAEPLFSGVEPNQYFRLVKAGFGEKRKTLLNSLSAGLHMEKDAARSWLESAGINPQLRAQNLSLQDWHELYRKRIA
jgi:16S rRNA (adenine1518-N6/adenine1519-N6)-dimethyltransferase